MRRPSLIALSLAVSLLLPLAARAADIPNVPKQQVPHGQTKVPGPALSPQEAMAKMELPPGFKIELVASEPEIVNPTSFTFDDQGRIWITESVEYPRSDAGRGKDRVKILESTKHDGQFDKTTIFKDGLNIPCGVVIGNGGVYVTNSPDILFLRDTDGDGRADKEEVILTGFGRDDRHELPNSLTWGPDGWLYGMNGVFNPSHVKDPATGKMLDFTCAIWRYHPKTKKLELFAEGTSNPWGLDYNRQGDWFVSCCVIDHLFHMTQSGYYLRQGGPYPPMTQVLPSITTERHEAAAYAGLCIYDADVFPEEYRGRLLMGNLHGSALNQDVLTRNGATYVQHNVKTDDKAKAGGRDYNGSLDFLQANDAWFMPVSQKIGPDGCLYVMDWYDRYHCYQDANRDSPGLDRGKGRIYRISYGDVPAYKPYDLQKLSTDELLKLLDSPNVFWRRMAQRVLNEKFDASMVPALQTMALDTSDHNNAHMHALWLLVSQRALDPAFHERVLASTDAAVRNWGVRACGEMGKVSQGIYDKLKALAEDPSPDVRVQVAVAAGRLSEPDPLPLFKAMLDHPANAKDPLIPVILYNNLKPLAERRGQEILGIAEGDEKAKSAFGESTLRWITAWINAGPSRDPAAVVASLKKALGQDPDPQRARQALQTAVDAFTAGGVKPDDRKTHFDKPLRERIAKLAADPASPARVPALVMSLWWRDADAIDAARKIVADSTADAPVRVALLRTLAESKAPGSAQSYLALAADDSAPILLRQTAVEAVADSGDAGAIKSLLTKYPQLPPDLRPMTVNALTHSRPAAEALLDAVTQKQVPASDVNANHVRQMASLHNADVDARIERAWGKVKTERDPERVKVVEQMKKLVASRPPGNPVAGQQVFTKTCAQCHTIYGQGGNLGPDLTGVGRENLDAILTNLLDPSLVIGAPYYVYIAQTKGGDTISGLLVENSDKQVILRDQTKQTVIPKSDLQKLRVQNMSMMPEALEKTMTEQELIDLVAFLLTREPPKAR